MFRRKKEQLATRTKDLQKEIISGILLKENCKVERMKWQLKHVRERKLYKYLLYTICFLGIVIPFFEIAYRNHYIILGGDDAVTQHYPAMLYISRVMKEFWTSLFLEGKLVFPMYEWTVGMGENTIATLNWYGFTDPLYWLAGFFLEEQLPWFYSVFFYMRVYLGGLCCIALLHELNDRKSDMAYVVGALVYSFTGFTLQCNIHIIFTHAMAYIPLMILGTERSIKGKRRGLLAVSTFLFALSGFFFLYIGSITIAVYTIYKMIVKRLEIKEAIGKIIRLLAEYFVGLGLAAVVFIPTIVGFLSSSRNDVRKVPDLLMSLEQIGNFLLNLFLPQVNNGQALSVSTIGVISILWMLLAKQRKTQKICIGLLFICVIVLPVTWVMTGFAGEYDRWQIVITLYVAYLVTEMWDSLEESTWIQRIGILVLYMVLGVYEKVADNIDDYRYSRTLLTYGVILVFMVVVLPFVKRLGKKEWLFAARIALFVVVVWSVHVNWKAIARDRDVQAVRQYDIVDELITEDDGYYRVDYEKTFSEPKLGMNISLMLDYMGITEYFSIINRNYMKAFPEWEAYEETFNNGGLDQRTILETAAAVKYFIAREENDFIVPYGFERVKTSSDGEWELWKNRYAVPMVYSYENILDKAVYDEMNGLEKQQVLLQAVAIEGYTGAVSRIETVKNGLNKGTYVIEELQNGVITDGIVSVESGAVMTILADLKANCENYLYFKDAMSVQIAIRDGYVKNREPITLGRVEKDVKQKITITFNGKSEFALDDMNIFYYDFENYAKQVNNMRKGVVEDSIRIENNRLECKVKMDEARILCMAAPYCQGWSAMIDGKKVDIYKINSMYMGIEVPAGEHNIEFKYVTPGIRLGGFVSMCTIIALSVWIIRKRYK